LHNRRHSRYNFFSFPTIETSLVRIQNTFKQAKMSGRAAHVEDIQDEEFNARLRAIDDEDDWKSEDDEKFGSETDDSDDDDDSDEEVLERGLTIPQETVWERISALRDIIPPSTRRSITQKINTITGYSGITLLWGGRAAWVLTTTMLLWGLPYSLAVEDEMRVIQQERDMSSQQHGAQSVSRIKMDDNSERTVY